MLSTRIRLTIIAALALAGAGALPGAAAAAGRDQSTDLISTARDGGLPNGESSHAVISGDRRYARAVAYQSEASDLVAGDTNGYEDVFVTRRDGPVDNSGSEW